MIKFYSGFSLKNEEDFFDAYRDDSAYCVSGFSYGAIKAFEYVQKQMQDGKRVDRLQLFSPAFFQTKPEKFKQLQVRAYKKSTEKYLAQFMAGCFSPYEMQTVQNTPTQEEELSELLSYKWVMSSLKVLQSKGVSIEVYLGGKDAIIDAKAAEEFFLEVATVTYIKKANHFLQIQ